MNKKSDKNLIFLSIFCAISIAALATITQVRESFRDLFINNKRIILAKADGFLMKDSAVTVVKVKTADTLSLEIYTRNSDSDTLKFLKRIVLPEKRDGHFTFRGNATNLVLTDLDGDGNLEIVAPAFDDNLIPRLNVYRYDPSSNSFLKMGADSIQL